jgi:hypothetical protein
VLRRRWRHRRRSVHSNRVGWASEPRKWDIAGAEAVGSAEGNMNGAVMQGAATLPWSRTPSRWKGSRRNLGDLTSPAAAAADTGHVGKSRRRSRRGRGEESDGCIVPVKPRTMPAHVGGGDGGGKAAGRREGEQRRMPRTQGRAWHVPEAVSLRIGAAQVVYASELRSRWTFDRSPVRESRTPGSVRGDRGNPAPTATSFEEFGRWEPQKC